MTSPQLISIGIDSFVAVMLIVNANFLIRILRDVGNFEARLDSLEKIISQITKITIDQ